jgi:hypothetical protein
MVDTAELENYLNEKSAKEGDMVYIISGGILESKEDPQTHRKYKVLNLPVRLMGTRELIYTPDKKAIEVLSEEFGSDSENWKGKEFKIKFYPKTVFGQEKTAILPVIEQKKA